jgi:hypothetical protein
VLKRLFAFLAFCVACCFASLFSGCRRTPPQPAPSPTPTPSPSQPSPPNATPSPSAPAYNQNAPALPDPRLTPGDVLDVTPQDFCTPGYSKKVRHVPSSVKKKVYLSYGITHRLRGEYEVDHLISLQLGGSNSVKNLWPQSYFTSTWNARVKDALENELHREICNGTLDYKVAQREIAANWIAAYRKYMKHAPKSVFHQTDPADTEAPGTPPPATAASSNAPDADAKSSSDNVWVNLGSGKYFHPGDRYYGHTRRGQYMSEAQAQAAGYREAKR